MKLMNKYSIFAALRPNILVNLVTTTTCLLVSVLGGR